MYLQRLCGGYIPQENIGMALFRPPDN